MTINGGKLMSHLVYFPYIRDSYLSSPDIQCLETNVSFILSELFLLLLDILVGGQI